MKNNVMLKAMAVAVVLLLSVAGKVNAQSTAAAKPTASVVAQVPVKKVALAVSTAQVKDVKTVSPSVAPVTDGKTVNALAQPAVNSANSSQTGAKAISWRDAYNASMQKSNTAQKQAAVPASTTPAPPKK